MADHDPLPRRRRWSHADADLLPAAALEDGQAERVNDFVRLHVIPEMAHCGGGPVPDFGLRLERETDAQHSMARALERWVETGAAPEAFVATKYETDGDRSSHVV